MRLRLIIKNEAYDGRTTAYMKPFNRGHLSNIVANHISQIGIRICVNRKNPQ